MFSLEIIYNFCTYFVQVLNNHIILFLQLLQGRKGDVGPKGAQGEKGDQGPQGIQGIQGPQGEPGMGNVSKCVYKTKQSRTSVKDGMEKSARATVYYDEPKVQYVW